MNATLHSSYSPFTTTADDTLARLGLTPTPGGYQRNDTRLTVGAHWCVLHAPGAKPPDDVLNGVGHPALWKHVSAANGARRIFALPRRVWDAALSAEADGEATVLEECLRWALDTADGTSPADWQPPARALVESWFKPEDLTVVAGALLRQGELIWENDCLALRFPLVPEISNDLPASRLAWLRALLEEAQDRWHLVRLGLTRDDDGVLSAIAEVDLTGVPQALADDLFVLSLEALRWVVQWLGETTDWLADAAVASELLAVCPTTKP